jgi:hypothetical protein
MHIKNDYETQPTFTSVRHMPTQINYRKDVTKKITLTDDLTPSSRVFSEDSAS